MKNRDEDAWEPCLKPCRFLQERLFDSPAAGVIAGVEQRCTNPVYDHLANLHQLLTSAGEIITVERTVLLGMSDENSYRRSRERMHQLHNLIWRMLSISAFQQDVVSRHHYYTKENANENGGSS